MSKEIRDSKAFNQTLQEVQKEVGSLQWLALKTRLDIAAITAICASMMSRNPWQALVWTQEVWKYLAHTRTLYTVVLPDQTHGVRIASDASFAPGGDRSRTGAVILVSGVIVHWISQRQTEAAASAHEAELTAAKMGSTVGLTIRRIVT